MCGLLWGWRAAVKVKTGCSVFRFNMLAKTRGTWKLDGMNTVEYEVISRQHLPLYTNITVNIGTMDGLHPPPQAPPQPAADKPAAGAPAKLWEKQSAMKSWEAAWRPAEGRALAGDWISWSVNWTLAWRLSKLTPVAPSRPIILPKGRPHRKGGNVGLCVSAA